MPLFEMTPEDLVAVPSSTFAFERVLERADLQRLLRTRIDAIVDDVLIVSEEFGAFADARRRIDLLGIDREGHLGRVPWIFEAGSCRPVRCLTD
jgi:hypothetical protein